MACTQKGVARYRSHLRSARGGHTRSRAALAAPAVHICISGCTIAFGASAHPSSKEFGPPWPRRSFHKRRTGRKGDPMLGPAPGHGTQGCPEPQVIPGIQGVEAPGVEPLGTGGPQAHSRANPIRHAAHRKGTATFASVGGGHRISGAEQPRPEGDHRRRPIRFVVLSQPLHGSAPRPQHARVGNPQSESPSATSPRLR